MPYGVYDINNNVGWVSIGTDLDTACFAVNAIRSWWRTMGKTRYPKAKRLMITADGGGSNGYRVRLWTLLGGTAPWPLATHAQQGDGKCSIGVDFPPTTWHLSRTSDPCGCCRDA